MRYEYVCRHMLFFKILLYVAMETMQFHTIQIAYFFIIFFFTFSGSNDKFGII